MTERAPDAPLTLRDLSRRYGKSYDWMLRHWRGMVDAGQLPAPLAAPGHPRWDPTAFDAAPEDAPDATPDATHATRARLARRAAALASNAGGSRA